ncbi:tRNA (adenosine(37)-N6)-dimethylallyltransferase MiaA [Rhizosphaericola mali]|uniref:tRNA dimethylallyltransferase n=1 Tax=Rhizosphaericola mali TaxID=2545455 RepID=A0A5P2FX67_9BACT|nr:tRNA (adenosine(37)-N6)-dimethylallyltransferase MiaA [Rhizosphaericola mali]QES87517.1 tRNA (adenosine(37)-N6)-dimethylallyltransferase MiaA [Rhizosphaericola mali]
MHKSKTLIVIAGPTASGKTALAVQLAQHWQTEILSADSRQCYKELGIAVAKPSLEEMAGIPHYFIDSHFIREDVNAGTFENYGLNTLNNIFSKNDIAIMVGGTGLYIKSLCEGIDEMPNIPIEVREEITQQFQVNGLSWLQTEVAEKDPLFWDNSKEKDNPQRLMRALEFVNFTGESIQNFKTDSKIERPFNIVRFAIDWDRPSLYDRINFRVDQMLEKGLVEEAKNLFPYRHLNALNTVGYKELFDHFDGNISLDQAIEQIKINTRHYAKRQITWFKKDTSIEWISATDLDTIIDKVENR